MKGIWYQTFILDIVLNLTMKIYPNKIKKSGFCGFGYKSKFKFIWFLSESKHNIFFFYYFESPLSFNDLFLFIFINLCFLHDFSTFIHTENKNTRYIILISTLRTNNLNMQKIE